MNKHLAINNSLKNVDVQWGKISLKGLTFKKQLESQYKVLPVQSKYDRKDIIALKIMQGFHVSFHGHKIKLHQLPISSFQVQSQKSPFQYN